MVPVNRDSPETESPYFRPRTKEQSTVGLKVKLEYTLGNAKMLAETLRAQILELSAKETKLKEAITKGRLVALQGVTFSLHCMSVYRSESCGYLLLFELH